MPSMAGDYELEALSVPESIEDLHDLMDRARRDHPEVPSEDLMMLETAVVEIAGNVVQHGRPEGKVAYRLRLEVRDDLLRVRLVDAGSSEVPWPPPEADPLSESGRGLALADAAVDRMDYERVGGQNRWVLERLRH
jgi:serine/threonine-protein kinase RsbW